MLLISLGEDSFFPSLLVYNVANLMVFVHMDLQVTCMNILEIEYLGLLT